MRYLIIALLLAGAAWAFDPPGEVEYTTPAEYQIIISGTPEGFKVEYVGGWWEVSEAVGGIYPVSWVDYFKDGKFYHYVEDRQEFYVDSLADIRPTPAEMEAR